MNRKVIWLVIGIPMAAVLMGGVMLYVALASPDPGIAVDAQPLTKTSYRASE